MNQARKSTPLLSHLFSLDIEQDKHEVRLIMRDLLQSWGDFNQGDYKHLRYARMRWNYKSGYSREIKALSPDDIAILDIGMAMLLDISPNLFELIKLRYIEKKTFSAIGANYLRLSQRSAMRHINLSERLIYNILASIVGSEKRQLISKVLLDSGSQKKINYYKL